MLAAVLAITPIVSLIVIAIANTGDLWSHLARYVLPVAMLHTVMLLAGVTSIREVLLFPHLRPESAASEGEAR